MKIYKPPFSKILFPEAVTKLKEGVYITIDDSPSENTLRLLDFLDEHGIKATFFSVGKNVLRFPEAQEEIKRRGHAVGVHSLFHNSAFKVSRDFYLYDMKLAGELIGSDLMRPPYGHLTLPLYKVLKDKYKIFLWSYMTYDFKGVKTIYVNKISNGSIIVLHDNPMFFEVFKEQILKIKEIAIKKNLSFKLL